MKTKTIVAALVLSSTLGAAAVYADETIGEKTEAATNDAARAAKKGAHRVEEATCMKSDTKCLQQKAEHRAKEAGDYAKDKTKEVKNSVDNDK